MPLEDSPSLYIGFIREQASKREIGEELTMDHSRAGTNGGIKEENWRVGEKLWVRHAVGGDKSEDSTGKAREGRKGLGVKSPDIF
jgi:hypothetical protein